MERIVNYYEILGLPIGASEDDIKSEIKNKRRFFAQRQNSPKHEIKQDAETKIKQLGGAEKILLDKNKRSAYDQELNNWLVNQPKQSADSANRETYDSEQDIVALGWKELEQDNIPKALSLATQATIRDGMNADAWALLGEANFRWGEVEEGIKNYLRAIKLRPNDAYLYFSLGLLYRDQKRWQEAYKQFDRAAVIDPATTQYRASKGEVCVRADRPDEGIPLLRQCILEEPQNKAYQWFLALTLADASQLSWTYLDEPIVFTDKAGSSIVGASIVKNTNVDGRLTWYVPSGYYATSRDQVAKAQELISEAEKLEFDDSELSAHIAKVREDIDSMLQREFNGSISFALIGSLLWLFVYGLGLIFGPAYWYASRPPKFAICKRYIKNDFSSAGDFMKGEEGIGAKLFAGAIVGAFLPVAALWNYVKNYTGENSTPKLVDISPTPASAPIPEASVPILEASASMPAAPAPMPEVPVAVSTPEAPTSPIPAVQAPMPKAPATKISTGMPKWAIPTIGGVVGLAVFAGGLLYYQKSQRETEAKLAIEREVIQHKEEEVRRLAEQAARLEAAQKAQKEEEVRHLAEQASQIEAEQKAQKEEEVRRLSEQVARLEAEQKAQADRQAQLQQQGQPRQQTARPAGRNNQSADDAMLNNAHKSLDALLKQ